MRHPQCPGAHGEPGPTLAPVGKGVCPECGRIVGLLTTRRLYAHTAEVPTEYRSVNDRPLPQVHDRTLNSIPGGPDPAMEALAHLHSEEAIAAIEAVLRTLTWREREVMKLRYGIGCTYTYTLDEVGRVFGVTRERIRQIEAKAVRKLQHPVRAAKLAPFLTPRKEAP